MTTRVLRRKRSSGGSRVLRRGSLLGVVVAQGMVLAAIGAEASAADASEKITYDDHIVPIFRRACFGCHRDSKKKGGLALSSYVLAMEGGGSGEVVVSGDPDGSRLLKLISREEEPHMPPRGEGLPPEELEVVRRWIAGGLLENKGSKALPIRKPKVELAAQVAVTGRPEGPPPMPRGLSLEPLVHTTRTTAVTAIAGSPWAPVVAVSGQHQVLLYHSDRLELLGVLPFPEGDIAALRFSRNGKLLLAAGGQGAHSGDVVVWDVVTGNRVLELGGQTDTVLAADISADHRFIALGGPQKLVRVYSTEDGSLVHELKKHTDWVLAVEFSPDGVLLASGDRNGGLHVWETMSGEPYADLRGHSASITAVSWRGDANVLASSSEDRTVRLWEMEGGAELKKWNAHGDGALSVAFLRDGRLASAGRDRVVKIWDQNGKQERALEPFSDLALEVAVTHEGTRVVGGDWTGKVRVWGTSDGKRLGELSTNPPHIADRLKAVLSQLEPRAKEEEALASRVKEIDAAMAGATRELEAAKKAVPIVTARISDARKTWESSRKAAEECAGSVTGTVQRVTEEEDACRKVAEDTSASPEKRTEALARLEAARKAAKEASSRLEKLLEERQASYTAMESAEKDLEKAHASVARLEPVQKGLGEERRTAEGKLQEVRQVATGLRLRRDRWEAAREVHKVRSELEALSQSRDELAGLLAVAAEEERKAASDLDGAEKKAGDAAARAANLLQTALKEAEQRLARVEEELKKAGDLVRLARAGAQSGQGANGAKLEELDRNLDALSKEAIQLGAQARDAVLEWAPSRDAARAAAKEATTTRAATDEPKARLEDARKKLQGLKSQEAELLAKIETKTAALEAAVTAYEAAVAKIAGSSE